MSSLGPWCGTLGIPADHGGPALCDGLGMGRSQILQVSLETPGAPGGRGDPRCRSEDMAGGQMHKPLVEQVTLLFGILGVPVAPPVLLECQAGPAKSSAEGVKELALPVTQEEATRSRTALVATPRLQGCLEGIYGGASGLSFPTYEQDGWVGC